MQRTQTYVVFRVTLMPSNDVVWAQMKPVNRGGEQVQGNIDVMFPVANAPTAGTKFMLTIERIVEEKK